MVFLAATEPAPLSRPEGTVVEAAVYTGTACLSFMDAAVTGEVWEDILYDGHDHEHGSGGLMLNSAAVGTHLEHDGDFPVEVTYNDRGEVVAFRVNLDPYAEDLAEVRDLDGHADAHSDVHTLSHTHSHTHDHSHDHDQEHAHEHSHGARHADGWSAPETIRLISAAGVFGDPAGLPEADDTGDLLSLAFPSPAGSLSLSVYTFQGLRRELVAVWAPAA